MKQAHDNIPPVERVRPAGIQTLPAFVVRTHVGVGSVEPSPGTDLFPSWYKPPSKSTVSRKTIDVVSNKLATDCTPNRAKKEMTDGDATGFSADKFVGGGGASTNEQDDVHRCEDAKPTIQIVNAPISCSGSCNITVQVSPGSHPLSSGQFAGTINLIIAGQVVQSFSVDDSEAGVPKLLNFSYSGSGSTSVTAEVVDSVLYDSSDSATINFTVAPSITLNASRVGNVVTFTWSGGSGPYNVFVDGNGSAATGCKNKNTNSCVTTVSAGPHSARLEDNDHNKSNTVNIP
jgi:hypothetical protein